MPFVKFEMTNERARMIRALRADVGCTWRRIAEICYYIFEADWTPTYNQIAGMELCDLAATQLGEKPGEDPWN